MIAVIAKITANPGQRDEVVAALTPVAEATKGEAGTLFYVMNLDKTDADVVWFYELYADDAALAAHSGSETMKAAGPNLAGKVAGRPELHMLDPVTAKGLPG